MKVEGAIPAEAQVKLDCYMMTDFFRQSLPTGVSIWKCNSDCYMGTAEYSHDFNSSSHFSSIGCVTVMKGEESYLQVSLNLFP
jgi:hypothetical protein